VDNSNQSGLPSVDRLLTLTDGVVAIALTLLVFQLKIPHLSKPADASQLADQLGKNSGQLISYGISFAVIAQFWLSHHKAFRHVAGHKEGLAWWNFAFLLTITLMPFTSNLLGEYGSNPLAVDIFAANLLLASLTSQITLLYAHRKGLLKATDPIGTEVRVRSALLASVIAASVGLAWVSPSAGEYCWLLMIAVPRAADRWARSRETVEASS
jgi:TMEM175 potassium channel family protein